jgi:hypothetical protein
MKNGCFEWPLSARLRERLQQHLEVHWPRLTDGKSTLLFPRPLSVTGVHQFRRAMAELLLACSSPLDMGHTP